jgi:hypothetical protein
MKTRRAVVLGGVLAAALGLTAFAISMRTLEASAVTDPRQEPPIVRLGSVPN